MKTNQDIEKNEYNILFFVGEVTFLIYNDIIKSKAIKSNQKLIKAINGFTIGRGQQRRLYVS